MVNNSGVSRYGPPVPGEIVVVKVGGSTLGEGDSTSPDIIELARRGFKPVVVHGGGAVISDWVKRLGIKPEFVRGLRRTDPETLAVAVAVLCGLVNTQLVAELNGLGGRAIGFSGISGGMLKARLLSEDLGLVGEIVEVDPAPIHAALDAGMIPVVAPAATNIEATGAGDAILNINADTSAGHIARRLEAAQMIFQTDVAGVLDVNRRLIPRMTKRQAGDLIAIGMSTKAQARAKKKQFVLGLSTNIPHGSHWHGRLDRTGVVEMKKVLDRFAATVKDPINGRFKTVESVNGGWLFWKEEPNEDLIKLHRALIPLITPLRASDIRIAWEMNEAQKASFEKWGYPNCMDAFDPHITLQLLAKEHAGAAFRARMHSYTALSLALVRIGEFGSAKEIIHEADLPQPQA